MDYKPPTTIQQSGIVQDDNVFYNVKTHIFPDGKISISGNAVTTESTNATIVFDIVYATL